MPESIPDLTDFQLSFGQALSRAVRIRCPYCGVGQLFSGWVRMNSVCAHCGRNLEREPGYFLGSAYINYGVTALITTISYVLLRLVLKWSQGVVMTLVLTFCLVFPLFFFRFARSLWLALDSCFDRVGAVEALSKNRAEVLETEKHPGSGK